VLDRPFQVGKFVGRDPVELLFLFQLKLHLIKLSAQLFNLGLLSALLLSEILKLVVLLGFDSLLFIRSDFLGHLLLFSQFDLLFRRAIQG